MNILIIDDNETDVKIALRAFSKAQQKANVFVAANGENALAFLRHEGKYNDKNKFPRPDIILLDIKMPKKDGFGVLEDIKKDVRYSFIPVIMLTSSKNEEDIMNSYRKGAAGFIPKPVNYESFTRAIEIFNQYWFTISKLANPEMCTDREA